MSTDQHDQHGQDRQYECPSKAAVTGLAREVEAMRRAMLLTATAQEVKRLAKVVTELSETVAAASASVRAEPEPVPSWLSLPMKERSARVLLDDLTGWMGGVYLRYADAARGLPECWLWHPEVVEELLWLMYAWLAAYRDDGASVKAAGDWHDRLRPGVVRRIGEYAKACSLENHLPSHATAAPEVPVVEAVDQVATWWGSNDRDQPGPTPTEDQMLAAAQAARHARGGARP